MNKNTSDKVGLFVDSVRRLFAEVESWVAQTDLSATQQEIEITEEFSGKYIAKKLAVEDNKKKKIAEFLPIGAFIIGGNGRVDMVGRVDKAILVNLDPDQPSMTSTMVVGDDTETQTVSFYEGVDRRGWYWIEDGRRGRANLFTKDLFIELLGEVSDYEIGQHS